MKALEPAGLDSLIAALKRHGYQTIGPRLRDGAIVYDTIDSIDDLPRGWVDEQSPGTYKVRMSERPAYFDYVVGPHSWKRFVFPPRSLLFSTTMSAGDGFVVNAETHAGGNGHAKHLAFIGVRPCELKALQIQDAIFAKGDFVDPTYSARRSRAFVVAVNCVGTGGNCFCVSMGTGPRASDGYDIALTELMTDGEHLFFAEGLSERGERILNDLPGEETQERHRRLADELLAASAQNMPKSMDTDGLKEILAAGHDSPLWDKVAARCLACANCTMVCPTCFCSTVEDTTDLTGEHAERWRRWDSCFTMDFARVAGGNFRPSVKARYRQWMTHKLSSWHDQFGISGCVGCGRCITWCPVGIDITEESRQHREAIHTTHV